MSMFGSIMGKIFHHPAAAASAPAAPGSGGAVDAGGRSAGAEMGSALGGAVGGAMAAGPGSGGSPASVDVGAVLAAMAAAKAGGGGNYQTSIVDLLRLLDMDFSIGARHTLAEEMGVHAGADGTAEQNVALHKAVVAKLAENGGVVPASMRG